MADTRQPREGYGGTSEQRQRGVTGDSFSERAPRAPEESEAARATPEKGGKVVHVALTSPEEETPHEG